MERLMPWMVAFGGAVQSQAAVIDVFASGNQSIAWPPPVGSAAIIDSVPISGSLFETRYLSFRSGGSQTLRVTTDEQVLEYGLGLGGGGYFEFGYRSNLPVDLHAGGATALRFHFEGATAGTRFPASLRFMTLAGEASYSWGFELTGIFNGHDTSFVVDVPFSEIRRGDLSQVTGMTFEGLRITEGGGFKLSKIETIPEPSMAVMTMMGGSLLCAARRRARRRSGDGVRGQTA
jgi:hypothetical protein